MARQEANEQFQITSFLDGANAAYIEQLYAQYEEDPSSVSPEWQSFFKGLSENPEDVKNLFRSTGTGGAAGIAVQIKAMTSQLLSNDGFFKSKDDTLQLNLKRNAQDQARFNEKVSAFEKRITARYNALDTQMSTLTGLNAYIAQQVTTWNKSTS